MKQTKKPSTAADKASRIKPPVQTTLEPDAKWHGGARQLVPHALKDYRPPEETERVVLPPRERQNAQTLSTTPGLEIYSTLHLLAHNNAWYRGNPEETLRTVAAHELTTDLLALHTSKTGVDTGTTKNVHMRYVHPTYGTYAHNTTSTAAALADRGLGGPVATEGKKTAERALESYQRDRSLRMVRFFEDDPVADDGTDDGEPYGMAPNQYRAMRNMEANMGDRFHARHETQRNLDEQIPRRHIEPPLSRVRTDELRLPAHGHFRPCKLGSGCIAQILAASKGTPELGYTEREYMSLDRERAFLERRSRGVSVSDEHDGPPDLCYDDHLIRLSQLAFQNQQSKLPIRECLNIFTVSDTEYARNYFLPQGDGSHTGIEGHVPQFLGHWRHYEKRTLPDGQVVNFLADLTPGFLPSLSEANTCLGAFKARPLTGTCQRFVAAAAPVVMPRRHLDQAAQPAAQWSRFLRECHPLVLADRQMLAAEEDGGTGRSPDTLPVAWLRRTLLPLSHTDLMTPLAVVMSMTVFRASNAHALDSLLSEWADLAFCTFERSVALWMQAVRLHRWALTLAPLALFFNARCYRAMRPYWDKMHDHVSVMPRPPSVADALHGKTVEGTWEALATAILEATPTCVLWAVAMWRCAAAVFFDVYGRLKTDGEVGYQTHLFGSTHDDFFTHLSLHGTFSDAHLFASPPPGELPSRTLRPPLPWLALYYPAAHRLCCAEELPDLAPALVFANPWYDTGSKKTQEDVLRAMLHLFVIKVMPEGCQRRALLEILERKGRAFPVLLKLARLVFKCVLLGNLPLAISRLTLAARVRVTASFEPFATPAVEADLQQWMRSKQLTLWFLLREYFFFHVENSYVLERVFGDSRKWPRFKALVRTSNGETRRDLMAQIQQRGFDTSISWLATERVAFDYRDRHGKDHYCIVGRLMDRHELSLRLFTKLKKGRFEEVFKKKARAIEEDLGLDYDAAQQFLERDERQYYCHLVAFTMAQLSLADTTPLQWQLVMPTRWLKGLGATKAGLADLREIQFGYYEYDTSDETLKSRIKLIYQRSWQDYVLFRTICSLYSMYREQSLYVKSAGQAHRTALVLRAGLGIEGYFATPPHLGRPHYCEGCHQWASRVLPCHPIFAGDLGASQEALMQLKRRLADRAVEHAVLYGERAMPAVDAQPLSLAAQRALAFGSNANEAAICGFRAVFIHPIDGKLYCKRGAAPTTAKEGGEEGEEEADPFDELALDEWTESPSKARQWMRKHAKTLMQTAAVTPAAAAPKDVSLLAAKNLSCNNPLVEVGHMGIVKRLHGRLCDVCTYCGQACEALNCNQTDEGVSCGNHALPSHYPDHHRLWLRLGMTRTEVLHMFPNPRRTPPCFVPGCHRSQSTRNVEAHDFQYKYFIVPLCKYHFECCSSLIPLTPRLSEYGGMAVVPPPVRIDHLMEKVWT